LARNAVEASRNTVTRILINDRLDVAWASGAAGVHLGENSLPVAEVSRSVPGRAAREFLVGASCHSLERTVRAAAEGADYVFFGPIFATPSKASFGEPQGLVRLEQVCRATSIPVLAIGGITEKNAAACIAAGAAGIAAIRLFQQAPDLAALLKTLR
jgi:thiamine-phosphate pyrophosphorylase